MPDVLEKSDTRPTDAGTGDHDRFAHYFAKADLEAAFFEGRTITALCGKRDVPTRDFTRFPVCPTCKEIREAMRP